jgi:hypothetical protein
MEALGDPARRVQETAMEFFESLGAKGAAIIESLQNGDAAQEIVAESEALQAVLE